MDPLSYADDITFCCPSVGGLNYLLNLCQDFATSNIITFSTKRTICIKYGECVKADECVTLNGDEVTWHNEVRHLGNHFEYKLRDIIDSGYKCWSGQ